jgi:hypothetical protein
MVVALFLGVAARPAAAGECFSACSNAKQVCMAAGIQARKACKADCAAATSRQDCFTACKNDFLTARVTCKSALLDCRNACIGGGGGGGGESSCAQQCGETAQTCTSGVRQTAITCGSGCQMTAKTAAEACHGSSDPIMCLLNVARGLGTCLGGCAKSALMGGQMCVDDLHTCLGGCQSSPSSAFLP